MNILHLTTHINAGGITTYIRSLAQEHINAGHRVFVVSSGGQLEEEFRRIGVTVVNLNIRTKSELHPKLYIAVGRLHRLIRENAIDVIHAHTRVTQVMAQILTGLTSAVYVSTCHGFYKTRWFRKVFSCWGDGVIAISPPVREHLLNDFRVPAQKIFSIIHGVEIPAGAALSTQEKILRRQERGITGSPVLGIIARLSDVKGHDILLRAMPRVLEKFPKASLAVVGEGKLFGTLTDLVGDLGLSKNVRFFPVSQRTAEFLPLFDVFVLPSLSEGLGLSVLEAQGYGLPVVASDVGGIKAIVDDGKTGFLFPAGDPQALAETIAKVLSQPQLAKETGEAAREYIVREHSSARMASETLGVYEQILAGRRRKP